jgi:hypothetical protein
VESVSGLLVAVVVSFLENHYCQTPYSALSVYFAVAVIFLAPAASYTPYSSPPYSPDVPLAPLPIALSAPLHSYTPYSSYFAFSQ